MDPIYVKGNLETKRLPALSLKARWGWVSQLILLSFWLGGCAEARSPETPRWLSVPSVLNPQGRGAAEIAALWWILFGLALLVFMGVMGLLLYALFRSRRRQVEIQASPGRDRLFIMVGGIAVPIIILVLSSSSPCGQWPPWRRPTPPTRSLSRSLAINGGANPHLLYPGT